MRKLFDLSSEERNRILSLHENSTKKQYLNVISEQTGTALDNNKLPVGNGIANFKSSVPNITPSAAPTTPATLKDVQTILSGLGYNLGKAGIDGKLGPNTLNALVAALKTSQKSTETSGSTATSGTTSGATSGVTGDIVTQLSNNPSAKAIMDKLTAGGVDITKLPADQILPKVQELAGDLLKADPNLLATLKSTIEAVTKTKLPDITAPVASVTSDASNPLGLFKQ